MVRLACNHEGRRPNGQGRLARASTVRRSALPAPALALHLLLVELEHLGDFFLRHPLSIHRWPSLRSIVSATCGDSSRTSGRNSV